MVTERSAPTNDILTIIREELKKRKRENLEQHLKIVDYHYIRSEDAYNEAISNNENVVVVCLTEEFNPFEHFLLPELDTYKFVDVLAKNHKEARFLIADSLYCPELVHRLNPDGVYKGFAAIKNGKREGFVTMSQVCDWSGDGDCDNEMALAKLLDEFGVITATESEKNYQPVDSDADADADADDDSFFF